MIEAARTRVALLALHRARLVRELALAAVAARGRIGLRQVATRLASAHEARVERAKRTTSVLRALSEAGAQAEAASGAGLANRLTLQ